MGLNGKNRVDVKVGAKVKIVLKADQRTGWQGTGNYIPILGKLVTGKGM